MSDKSASILAYSEDGEILATLIICGNATPQQARDAIDELWRAASKQIESGLMLPILTVANNSPGCSGSGSGRRRT